MMALSRQENLRRDRNRHILQASVLTNTSRATTRPERARFSRCAGVAPGLGRQLRPLKTPYTTSHLATPRLGATSFNSFSTPAGRTMRWSLLLSRRYYRPRATEVCERRSDPISGRYKTCIRTPGITLSIISTRVGLHVRWHVAISRDAAVALGLSTDAAVALAKTLLKWIVARTQGLKLAMLILCNEWQERTTGTSKPVSSLRSDNQNQLYKMSAQMI